MKNNFFIFILFILTVATSAATVFANEPKKDLAYEIRGVVRDEQGRPMSGVAVWVEGTTFGANTNSQGLFILRFREDESVSLRFSYVGYRPQQRKAQPSRNKEQFLQITLAPAVNALEELVVTGSRIAKPLKEVPTLTRIISAQDIKTLNPMNVENLLVYELPGLQIGYNNMIEMPQLSYQGVGGAYVLFLVDGERIGGEGSDKNVDFSRLNIDDIERIEVIKGSQSSAYGSNALGGVINIITKQANRPILAELHSRYSPIYGQKYTASAGVKKDRFSSYTSITHRRQDTYSVEDTKGEKVVIETPDGSSSRSEETVAQSTYIYGYKIWNATQRFAYNFNKKFSMNVKGSYYHNRRAVRKKKKYRDLFSDASTTLKFKYLLTDKQQLNMTYLFDYYWKDKDFFVADFKRTDYKNRLNNLRLDYNATFGKHHISSGIEYLHEYIKHYMLKDSADAQVGSTALYLQDEWNLSDQLNLIAGLRADYHNKYKLHLTPKLSLMYTPIKELIFRAGYSQGFRSPSLKELYQAYDMGGLGWFMLYGNPDLEPETSNQYALSVETNLGGLNVSVSGYKNFFQNKIAYQYVGDGSSDLRYVNAEKARTMGIETIVRYRSSFGLTVTGSYGYINDYEEVNGRNTSNIRPHTVTMNANYSRYFGKVKTMIGFNGRWVSPLTTYNYVAKTKTFERYHYRSRTMCSMNLGAELPWGIRFTLGVDNLFNFKDKASESFLQLPQKGTSIVLGMNINIADMLKL